MKTNKYNYLRVIQQNYGQGWEDVSEYEATSSGKPLEYTKINAVSEKTGLPKIRLVSLLSQDLKEYQLTGYSTRVIFRKELNESVAL